MIRHTWTSTLAPLFVFLLVFTASSISMQAFAQEGVLDKTKEGLQEGGEAVKEGAETVGREGEKVITGDDESDTDTDRQKATTTDEMEATSESDETDTTYSSDTESDDRELPATAGGLSLLALAGALAVAGGGIARMLRR
jgi:hypothetical protein